MGFVSLIVTVKIDDYIWITPESITCSMKMFDRETTYRSSIRARHDSTG